MAVGWKQFDDVNSNFRQDSYGYTTDGGLTWTFPGVLKLGVFRSDPVTGSDETGTFFYLSLRSEVNQSFFCDDMWRSTNRRPDLGADLGQAGERSGATNNGLPSTTATARVTDSNTKTGARLVTTLTGGSSLDRLTAE